MFNDKSITFIILEVFFLYLLIVAGLTIRLHLPAGIEWFGIFGGSLILLDLRLLPLEFIFRRLDRDARNQIGTLDIALMAFYDAAAQLGLIALVLLQKGLQNLYGASLIAAAYFASIAPILFYAKSKTRPKSSA